MTSRRWQRHRSPPFALSVAKRSRSADIKTTKPNRRKRPVRVWLALCACAALLTGCVHTTKADFLQHYTLSTPAPSPAGSGQARRAGRGILQITNITVPEWLDGTAMYYRLDYEADGRLAAYANSDWVAPPAALLEPLLQQTILSGAGWRAVIGPRNPASADVTLQIRLDDFSQSFARPDASTGVLDATATLISSRAGQVIGQRHFHVEVAAPTPNAQGGAKALGDASAKFAGELQRWMGSEVAGANAAEDR